MRLELSHRRGRRGLRPCVRACLSAVEGASLRRELGARFLLELSLGLNSLCLHVASRCASAAARGCGQRLPRYATAATSDAGCFAFGCLHHPGVVLPLNRETAALRWLLLLPCAACTSARRLRWRGSDRFAAFTAACGRELPGRWPIGTLSDNTAAAEATYSFFTTKPSSTAASGPMATSRE